ncbi:glycosyltransferase family 2 protein [Dysgonomonas macrotermitis]|uniref:Glycosyl transferase family 2 n=1 Tax=Dysgonomonas macrotermitis TaxID=1346286 RepID=A0A1M4Y317_9BACT|nr:glycosyltransferase family 2 protein [Dysgonomonas macrotermitis]SHE99872.1 Glycosyl transferase family 2 [Dysgonomonas macrotermitis]
MTRISIITVNRNNAEGLEKTIISVISQTYTNYEFIVIDGASTDRSREVISKYGSNIHYWVSEPDSGIFNAMNKGIEKVTGDYCYFLNSADAFASNTVLEDIFGSRQYSAPFINGNQLNNFGTYRQRVPCLNRPLTLFDFYWGTIKHQATFIRKDLFDTYGLYDETLKIIADWKFFLQTIGLHNEQPDFVDIDIVDFEWNGMSTNPEFEEKHRLERNKVLDDCIPASIQADYVHLREMSNYRYISDAMKKNKILDKIIRGLVKILN